MKETLAGGLGRHAIPAEGSAETEPKGEKQLHGGVHAPQAFPRQKCAQVDDGAARPVPGKVDGPDVVQRHTGEQGMGYAAGQFLNSMVIWCGHDTHLVQYRLRGGTVMNNVAVFVSPRSRAMSAVRSTGKPKVS